LKKYLADFGTPQKITLTQYNRYKPFAAYRGNDMPADPILDGQMV